MSHRLAPLGLILALGVAGCSTAGTPTPLGSSSAQPTSSQRSARPTRPTPRTARTAPASAPVASGRVTKVLVFIVENHSLSQMRSEMPYAFGLAQRFGYATSYTAVGHPSLPNYVAVAGGQTYGITNDDQPSEHPIAGTSVFGQAVAAGRTAGVFAEGMPQNCGTSDGGSRYAVRHNPWAYFTNEREACQKYDVPVDQLGAASAQGRCRTSGC